MQAGYASFSHMLEPDDVLKEAKKFLEGKFKQQIWIYKEPRQMGGYFYHILFAKNVFWGFHFVYLPNRFEISWRSKNDVVADWMQNVLCHHLAEHFKSVKLFCNKMHREVSPYFASRYKHLDNITATSTIPAIHYFLSYFCH